jgi:poly-gamma-glutamate synthesis protein (capsule biosynthesis protein)
VGGGIAIELLFTGDIVLDVPRPDHWLSGISAATLAADAAIGHLEVPHTRRGVEQAGDVPAPGADPENLAALRRAGFAAVTLAGNHIADCGAVGISDTLARLDELGIAHGGAGLDLAQARKAASLSVAGLRVRILSYNCVGPEHAWAGANRAGCAYVRVNTADGSPITPAADLVAIDRDSLAEFERDIAAARADCDLLGVALHKGIVHTPARLAAYERPLAHAAVDAGADIVVGHHAHILRGIEMYRGRAIFHGLGNGCVVTRALSPEQDHPSRAAWAERRQKLFGFVPDPSYFLAPFHPEAVHAMFATVRRDADGTLQAGFIPVYVEAPGRPVLAQGAAYRQVVAYVDKITVDAGLPPLVLGAGLAGVLLS